MKHDIHQTPTKSALKVLNAFLIAFFTLLTRKSFETITVNEICENAGYPRATFYNYFDDKYDLLNYLFYRVKHDMNVEELKATPVYELLDILFDRLYNLFEKYESEIKFISNYNTIDGLFFSSAQAYLNNSAKEILGSYLALKKRPVSDDLMINHFSNTLMLIFQYRFIKHKISSKEETKKQLYYLLNNL